MIEKLRIYLREINIGESSEITELTDGLSNNHLNYKIVTNTGIYVARVTKPGDLLSYTNLPDEYTLLKKIEGHGIGPKAFKIDLEGFDTPVLIEEFVDGVAYANSLPANEEMFDKAVELFVNTSKIPLNFDEFPFKFTYTTFQTNFRAWDMRMGEIIKAIGVEHQLVIDFSKVINSAKVVLEQNDSLLKNAPREFVYNDVHPGNLFWIAKENKAKFIDWQKVSLGNPAFMIALFARRFGYLWGMDQSEFSKKIVTAYQDKKGVSGIEELFHASVLERSVADMIWSVWAELKKGEDIKNCVSDENKYYIEATRLIVDTD